MATPNGPTPLHKWPKQVFILPCQQHHNRLHHWGISPIFTFPCTHVHGAQLYDDNELLYWQVQPLRRDNHVVLRSSLQLTGASCRTVCVSESLLDYILLARMMLSLIGNTLKTLPKVPSQFLSFTRRLSFKQFLIILASITTPTDVS